MSEVEMRRAFLAALGLGLVFKLFLAATLPLTAEEAYFLGWSRHLALGYYDHPPLTAWWLALMSWFGDSLWWLRLPALAASLLVGYGIYRLLRDADEHKAYLAALLFMLAPASLLNVFISAEIGLALFSFLSVAWLWRGGQRGDRRDFVVSGVFLGLAFLSRQLALLLALAYLVYWWRMPRRAELRGEFGRLFLAAAPFVLLSLAWNATHCWASVRSGLNAVEGTVLPTSPLLYVLWVVYGLTPVAAFVAYRQRRELADCVRMRRGTLLATLFLVPTVGVALAAFATRIAPATVLFLLPFGFMFLALALDKLSLFRLLRYMVYFTAAHVIVILLILLLPLQSMRAWSHYDELVMMWRPQEVLAQLMPYEDEYAISASDDYATAALLSFHARREFAVFGEGASQGRQDDFASDFREFNGKNLLILAREEPEFDKYGAYFKSIAFRQFEVDGVTFHLVLGKGFDYRAYRAEVLRRIKNKHYTTVLPGACFFCARYFPGEACQP